MSSWIQALLQDSAVRELRHALPWMPRWKSQCRGRLTNARWSQQQATGHRDLHGQLSQKGPVWLGVHDQAGWKDCTRRQWSPESHDLQPDHGGRSSQIFYTMASLPAWRTDHTCHSHRLNKLLQNVESGMSCPELHTAMHSLRLQRLLWINCPGQREWTDR